MLEVLIPIIYDNKVCYCEKREFPIGSEEAQEAKEIIEKMKKNNIQIIEVKEEDKGNAYYEFARKISILKQKNEKTKKYNYQPINNQMN